MKILLPSQINPPRLRKDGSASLAFDTRELNAEEIFIIMQMRHTEGWLCFAPNEHDIEIPKEDAEVEGKSDSERLRNVHYILYKQESDAEKFVISISLSISYYSNP